MPRALIAVVDDEPDIVHLVSLNLRKAGFEVKGFSDAMTFLRFVERSVPALVILDVMLPDVDGFDVCRNLKAEPRLAGVPVIMLTAKGGETDRVVGLELGADDYVTKPFSVRELVARVKAVLRRRADKTPSGAISIGADLAINPDKYEVLVAGKRVELTASEFRILALLASREGHVFSRDQILSHLWGHDKAVVDRTVDVHIKNLRDKLGKAARHIKNVRGVGYKVEE
jgi:two-component system phosphate regulon response regulator PhoB/two-component system alkaline phosphatase synthesis response regulator PhoP